VGAVRSEHTATEVGTTAATDGRHAAIAVTGLRVVLDGTGVVGGEVVVARSTCGVAGTGAVYRPARWAPCCSPACSRWWSGPAGSAATAAPSRPEETPPAPPGRAKPAARPVRSGHAGAMAGALRRLVLVDDHRMVAEALEPALSAHPDLRVVGWCPASEPRLAARVAAARPDVAVIDVEPLGAGTAAALTELLGAVADLRVVVLTAATDPAQLVAAVRAGALAWLTKDCAGADLVAAVRAVCCGDAHLSPADLGVVLRALRAELDPAARRADPLAALSRQERRVLAGLVDGAGGAEIAAALGVSAGTVRTHLHNVFGKLGVHSRLEAVRVARTAGLRPRAPDSGYPDGRM
jgi:two-component system, NarL family, response regulator LiaR